MPLNSQWDHHPMPNETIPVAPDGEPAFTARVVASVDD
jgi:hypothetical protein